MDVEDGDGVLEWVGKDVVPTGVFDGVLPYRGVPTNGGGEVWRVLCDVYVCGWVGRENGLLEVLESVGLCVFSLHTLCQGASCDKDSFVVLLPPVVWEGCDQAVEWDVFRV